MDINANRKRNMDVNGNHNNSHFIPKYVDKQKQEARASERFDSYGDTESLIEDSKPSCCGIKTGNRYNPIFFNCAAYFGAALFFLIMINILNLPDIYYPTIGNLLPPEMCNDNFQRILVLVVLWGFHFVKRFGEVLFVHIYSRGFELIEAIGVIIYYSFFGLWIGWSVNIHIGYQTPPDWLFIPGILICLTGEIGNFICHLYLRVMSLQSKRRPHDATESNHVMPDRCCFTLVSCPHYLFEIITWIGFSLTAFTLASWIFTLATFVTLVIYSRKRHNAYKREFNGKHGRETYPKNRKALIPFVL